MLTPETGPARAVTLRAVCALLLSLSSAGGLAAGTAPLAMDLGSCLARALAHNPSLAAAERRWRAAGHESEAAGASRGPSIVLRDNYDRTDRAFNPFFFFPKTSHVASAELRQSVYNGGRLAAAEHEATRRADGARWQFVEARFGVVEGVVRSYLDWLQQEEVNGYYRSAIERDEKLVNEIAMRVQAGRALDAERLQARIRVLDDQRKLLEGKNRAELARTQLLVFMDLPRETAVAPVADLEFLARIPEPVGQLESNAALLASSAAVAAARAGLERARGESHPTVDVAVRRSHVLDGLSFSSFDEDYTNYLAVVEFPLFDGGQRRERKAAARAGLEASRDEYRHLRRQKELELTRAQLDLGEARNRVDIAREKREAAAENLRVAKERYDAGTVLLSETLDAAANAELAATEEIAGRFDVHRAKVALLRLQGRMAEAGLLAK